MLDASVAAKWFLFDERDRFAALVLDRVAVDGAVVPALFRWELENVLLSAERAGRIDPNDVDAALETLRDLPIEVDSPGTRFFAGGEVRLARYYDLTPYDSAYLALAATRRLPLATFDDRLAYAARDLGLTLLAERRR